MSTRSVHHVSADPLSSRNASFPPAVAPQPVPEGAALDHPSLYFNRELGWLDFNWRVLHQARDRRVPLLERVRFLAISCSNLDEFTQKRVGGLKRQAAAGIATLSRDGRAPAEQLRLIRAAMLRMQEAITDAWETELRPLLRSEAGIVVSDYAELEPDQQEALDRYYHEHIYPVLTPLAVDPGHPFPFISNLSLSLAVLLRHPTWETVHFARLKVPTGQGRWLAVPNSRETFHFVPVEQVIQQNVAKLFRGMEVAGVYTFRVTRNADITRDDEEAEDLIAMISDELRERRFAPVVRLEVQTEMPAEVRHLLLRELELERDDIYEMNGPLNLADCGKIADLDLPQFKFEPWEPVVPAPFIHEGETEEEKNIFAIIRRGDILVQHPYEAFGASTQRFLDEAADDPQVVAIKQTLYRTSDDSPVLKAVLRAAERGKQVAVLVEVKARFDEANNIEWGQRLEDAGVHVTYGLVGLKTHAKVTLVVRYEGGRPRTYCHIGTGNYHVRTARLYSDLGLLTYDPVIGEDLVNLFHALTGHAPDQRYAKLLVAPRDLRLAFEERIDREIEMQQRYGTGRIIAKVNALDDAGIIRHLYRASQAGVRIELIVRGHSRMRPGLAGYSETVRIISIIGRFLEHDRMYVFHNNGDPEVLIGSADWRYRNLAERVEVVVPVQDPALQQRILGILEIALADNRLAWELHPDGRYVQRHPEPGTPEISLHDVLMQQARERTRRAHRAWAAAAQHSV